MLYYYYITNIRISIRIRGSSCTDIRIFIRIRGSPSFDICMRIRSSDLHAQIFAYASADLEILASDTSLVHNI